MRPEKLVISAFGPYRDQVEIDFKKLGAQGLFLVTGDTGAGKTTIFDAITFALYGQASGNVREAGMFRSKYADEGTSTFVDLTFSCHGAAYRLVRSPEYLRPKGRGTGMTMQKAEAALYYPDGRPPVTKTREVTRAVEELLGLDYDQFTRIAMIAQGDFQKLLLAGTAERGEIFRQLFHTEIYQELQERLRLAAKAQSQDYEELRRSICQHLSGISCGEHEALRQELEQLKKEKFEGKAGRGLELLEELIEQDTRQLSRLDGELSGLEEELARQDQLLGKIRKNRQLKKELEEKRQRLQELLPLLAEKEAAFGEAAARAAGTKELSERVRAGEELAFQCQEKGRLEAELSAGRKRLSELGGQESQAKEREASLQQALLKIQELDVQSARLGEEAARLSGRERELQELSSQARKREALEQELAVRQQSYLDACERRDAKRLTYQQQEQQFFDAQAGILAQRLEPGKKCPVCGSLHHPEPARLSGQVLEKQQLQKQKRELEALEEEARRQSAHAQSLRMQLEEAGNQLLELARERLGEEVPGGAAAAEALECAAAAEALTAPEASGQASFFAAVKEQIRRGQEALREEQQALSARMRQVQEEQRQKKALEQDLKKCRDQLLSLQEQTREKDRAVAGANARLAQCQEQMERLWQAWGREEMSDGASFLPQLRQETAALKKQVEQLEAARSRAEEEFRQVKDQTGQLQAAVAALQNQTEEGDALDESQALEQKQQLQEKRDLLRQKRTECYAANKGNQDILRAASAGQVQLVEAEQRYIWLKALSDTANGTLSGKQKVEFETYVQAAYFDRILRRANLRLLTMSGGQYELKRCREDKGKREKSGLELNVVDHYNGSERSVKTLSGGESFQASLSLALGLADEVQSRAGGIRLDTMFVDEGFGSLDEEALDLAMKALSGLAEGSRMVGIISHVAELKERVEKKIVVKKEQKDGIIGSKVEIYA